MNNGIDNSEIRKFLLGSADDTIVDEIGVRLIADEEFAEQVSMVEESIIEDFLEGELDEAEIGLFRENFMTSPARARLLEEISVVRIAANAIKPAEISEPAASASRRFIPAWGFAAALLILLIAGIFVWRIDTSESLSARETEYAAINAGDSGTEAARRGIGTTVLVSGSLRGAGASGRAKTGSDIFLNLALPEGAGETRYDLEIRLGNTSVFRQKALQVIRNSAGGEIRALVPPLEKGDYRIIVGRDIFYDLVVE